MPLITLLGCSLPEQTILQYGIYCSAAMGCFWHHIVGSRRFEIKSTIMEFEIDHVQSSIMHLCM